MSKVNVNTQLQKANGQLIDVKDIKANEAFIEHFQTEIDAVKAWGDQVIGKFENTIYTKDSYFGNSASTTLFSI